MPTPNPFLAAQENAPHNGPICSIQVIREQLDKEMLAFFDDALRAPLQGPGSVQHRTICLVLKEMGYHLAAESLSRHRRGLCRCDG